MDPHSFIARAEAQRWLGIAEKLLISNDFVGSKTFAIRARESDPRLESADQILAIADTLLAAEKRVVGNNGAHQPDYYAILQLVRFVQDTDHIASKYRRLAVALNPHQNRFPYADQAFQLVNDAWAVLSNPMRKSMYDSDLHYPQHTQQQQQMNSLGFNLEQQQQQHHQQQQPHNFFSINHMGGGHENELPEQQQTFQSRLHQQQQQHQHQQLQQHNFLSQPNPVRPLPVREQEHMFREQEQLFQSQVQPFQVTSPPHQQTRPSPQPSQSQTHIQSPPATPQSPFSWPQSSQISQKQQQFQHPQIKQEQQHHQQHQQQHQMKHEHHIKQEQHLHQQLKQEQLKLHHEQLKQQQLQQQQLQEEQRKQQQLQEEQRKQQQLQQEQLKQQQLLEEQRKQQQLIEEQRKQQQLIEEQRKQQQLIEEQRKQQQLLEEQRKQQQLIEEQRKQQQLIEEQRKQQQILEEQRKQQQLLEEQRKQQQLLEEQRKQQQLLEEQRKQQQIQEEQRKQQQLQEEQRKQQQLLEEQRKQQLLEEQRKQQLLEEQLKQQQRQEEQRKQQEQERQQQESVKQKAAPDELPSQINSNNGARVEEIDTEAETETEVMDDSPTFWTACPYCFYMYEYPKIYVECTLRCDNCKRAFQAVRISTPPPIIEGQDACFYCWGFIPLGLSMSHLQTNNNKGTNSTWTPFSSLHNASNNFQNHLNEQAAPKENSFVNKSSGPHIYVDDITDDVFIGVSEPSSDSDTEWVRTKKQKSKRIDKGFKERIQVLALRAIYTRNGSVKSPKGFPVQKGVEVPTLLVVETSNVNVSSNSRKQSGRVAKELGKLDLNVEFSTNEGEETAPRMTAGTRTLEQQGEEDNIEGTEFFEGLDEYLSSLPILSVVNDEKAKVA
ncbi:hypothetical protein QVD17_06087 [Tagetes erecta]|uniref:J domain-containing protein n=1 Tax=Tagetes erecta TaxID=13708 RepID=A0AAD8LL12_TARER|nr:hypothetical protein QVD17_06087 [Tagetes erecta]